MKSISPARSRGRALRLTVITLLSFAGAFALMHLGASARRASLTSNPVEQQPLAPNAPSITVATLSDNTAAATKLPPGSTINYTAVISNTAPVVAGNDATNVIFSTTLDANTTLVPLSVNTTPIANNDSFPVYGNVNISIPDGGTDLLGNDFDPDNGNNSSLTVTTTGLISSASCAACNNVNINANGSFTYDPPVGFIGNDTFTYTVRDNGADGVGGNADDKTAQATVTLNITGMIWFINNAAAACTTLANQCGKLSKPFSSLDSFRTVNLGGALQPASGHDIFVYQSATANTLTATLALLANQRLIGQDSAPNATAINAATLFNITLPTGSATLPSTDTAGNTVSITGFGLSAASGNTIRGLTVNNTGVNTKLAGTSFGTLTLGDINLTGTGKALNLVTGTLATHASAAAQFTSLSSTSSASQGVQLSGVAGSLTAGGAISGSTSSAFQLGDGLGGANTGGTVTVNYSGTLTAIGSSRCVDIQDRPAGAGNITFSGTLTHNSGAGTAILMDDNAAGTITFSGTGSVFNTSTSTAINLTDNSGATINFSGGLNITTSSGVGFNATGPGPAATSGGTINVCDENPCGASGSNGAVVNTITTTTTGAALNVANTTIGASNLEFRSITVGTAANSAGLGISLDTTGSTGGLKVKGNGSAGTGGTIQHKTGADSSNTAGIGIFLNETANVDLNWMQLNDFDNHGIKGKKITNFRMVDCVVSGIIGATEANPAADSAILLDGGLGAPGPAGGFGVTGTVTFIRNNISGGRQNNVKIDNQSGTMNLNFVDNNVHHGSPVIPLPAVAFSADGFNLELELSAVMFANISDNDFTAHGGDHFNLSLINNANADLTFKNNNMEGGHHTALGAGVFILGATYDGTFKYDISNNGTDIDPFVGNVQGGAIHVNKGSGTATFSGQITNNVIGNPAVTGSGSAQAFGIIASARGVGGSHTTLINNNKVRQWFDRGIVMEVGEGGGDPTPASMTATVTNNTVSNFASPGAGGSSLHGIHFDFGIINTDNCQITVDVRNNLIANAANEAAGGADFRMRTAGSNDTFVAGCGTCTSGANTQAFIDGQNPDGTSFSVTSAASGTYNNGPASPLPAPNLPTLPPPATIAPPADEVSFNTSDNSNNDWSFLGTTYSSPVELLASIEPFVQRSASAETFSNAAIVAAQAPAKASETTDHNRTSVTTFVHRALNSLNNFVAKVDSLVTPTVHAQNSSEPNAPQAGEIVTVNGGGPGFTLPAGKSITVTFSATVNTAALTARQASTQGTISGSNFANVPTDDPDVGGTQATVTLLDTTLTWNGVGTTPTDWNDPTNWNRPGPAVSSYAPGVTNPAVNDVLIPNVGAQPNISVTDIGVYSLNISSGRTLTITSPRVLTIGGSPGGDLTLDGIISGGNLNLGTGTHGINNAGGTGSLSSNNSLTILSGSTTTLNGNLQIAQLTVNSGGSLNITNRTLSLNGTGLTVQGGATFTTTTSTVIFNGTAAQTAAGIAYNNLTINNSAAGAPNALGVTLTGNATVNGVLALTSNDLNTGAFTLTQPNTTASTGISDVVGTVTRSGGPFGLISLTFGNPNNIITFTGAGTRPTTMTVVMAKAAPATYAAAVQRNYSISQTGGTGFTATARLHYLDSELNGNTPETSLGLRRFRTSDSHWVAAPPPPGVPTRDGTANWIEATGVLAADLTTQWTFSVLAPTASDGSITGRIVDGQGNPVEGAVIRLEGTQNRKFITDANGLYRFDNVETGGFYTITPSRVNYSFTPSSRSVTVLGESTEAAFSAAPTGQTENPLDTPEYFVRQHYLDFLGREPDEAGFNFWSDQILECGNDQNCIGLRRENVSAAYFLSIEFRNTGGLVDGLYRASYGVRPNFAEFMPDLRAVGLGVRVGDEGWEAKLAANKEAFVNAFVNRAAFHAAYDGLENTAFVDTLISHTGVTFTASEREALTNGLATGTMTRAEVLRSIAENSSFTNAKFNETFVMMEYFGYLRRDPDSQGFTFWLTKLNEFNGNFQSAEMVKAFIVSGEYRDRFPR